MAELPTARRPSECLEGERGQTLGEPMGARPSGACGRTAVVVDTVLSLMFTLYVGDNSGERSL